jgi:hypothetical protein
LLPTCTLPNARFDGVAASDPAATAATAPDPETAMVMFEVELPEVILTVPLAAPLAVGENTTLKDVLWPLPSVTGRASPLTENSRPIAVTCEIVRGPPPVLVKVSAWALSLPTFTLPNARLEKLLVSIA